MRTFSCESSDWIPKYTTQATVILLNLKSDDITSLFIPYQLISISLKIKAKAAVRIHPIRFISPTQLPSHPATLVSLLLTGNSPGLFLPWNLCTCCSLSEILVPSISTWLTPSHTLNLYSNITFSLNVSYPPSHNSPRDTSYPHSLLYCCHGISNRVIYSSICHLPIENKFKEDQSFIYFVQR